MTQPASDLQSTLDHLPKQPGVYLMKGKKGEILYIGKARVLSDRVRSYFLKGTDLSPKNRVLIGLVQDIETIVTGNEKEALLLENTLIKKHRPRYNIKLRDDSNYLVLRLDPAAEWPRLEVVRRVGHHRVEGPPLRRHGPHRGHAVAAHQVPTLAI